MAGDAVSRFVSGAERESQTRFEMIDSVERENTARVLEAFKNHRVSQRHFSPSTGYGYGDIGRDTISDIMAELMGCEAAVVRPQIASGTHALAICLFGILRPGDVLVSAAGKPYDTLDEIIGSSGEPGSGSLADYSIGYRQAELKDGRVDLGALERALDDKVKLVLVQRSRGYDWRPSLTPDDIRGVVEVVRRAAPGAYVMVDNCYGEFTLTSEPGHLGADIMAGSMIKNPGGGLAPTGGYIAGRRELVELASSRLTSPGIGGEVGSYAGGYQSFYQGLFMAPHTVAQALKTAVLAAAAFGALGYEISPPADGGRQDIIQAIKFRGAEELISFVRAIQAASPVDSEAVPEPWDMPGYQHPVIMAAGTFVSGASIELSADAPIREPYAAYLQGGLTYQHGRLGVEAAIRRLIEGGYIEGLPG